jgi:uncharacterized membrane protein (DUF106 family)
MSGLFSWFPVLPVNVEIVIIVIALVYTSISIIAQRKLTNPKRMREIQNRVKEVQKEMNELIKSKAPQEQMMEKQKEVMPLLGEQMKSSLKPMFVIFPLLLITYYLLIPNIPIISSKMINPAKELFFIIVFAVGIVSAIVILIYDRGKANQEKLEREKESSATAV